MRGIVGWVLGLVLGLVLVQPSAAEACSCGIFETASVERCATASRVFAGTVASYREPDAFDLVARDAPWEFELVVDRVWRGDVPSVMVVHLGVCGYGVPPGTRFVVCDDEPGAGAPSFHFCDRPAFDEPELERALGPIAHVPDRRFEWARRAWRWARPTWMIPAAFTLVAALLGRVARPRVRSREQPRPHGLLALAIGLGALVGWLLWLRGVAHVLDSKLLAGFGPVAATTAVGAVVGFVGQQRPTWLGGGARAVVVSLVYVVVMAVVGYVELPGTR